MEPPGVGLKRGAHTLDDPEAPNEEEDFPTPDGMAEEIEQGVETLEQHRGEGCKKGRVGADGVVVSGDAAQELQNMHVAGLPSQRGQASG